MSLISKSRPNRPVMERIQRRVTINPAGCWVWAGRIDRHGYGRYNQGPGQWLVHRIVYTAVKGAIPPGMEIDHLCRNKLCCNPDHLDAVTGAENRRRQGCAAIADLLTFVRRVAEYSDYTHDEVSERTILHDLQHAAQTLLAKVEGQQS